MLNKLKSILGKDADASKQQRINPLKSLRQPAEPVILSLHDIGDWLDNQEVACKKERNESLALSREVITQLLPAIREAVVTVDDAPTDEPLHPKVVQVNTQQLPLFKSKIFSALDIPLSDDDEEFYSQIALILSAILRAFRGPGRYLHQSYPQGIRDLRDRVDSFGKEINVMTAVMKSSRERFAHIEAVHQAYDKHEDLILQCSNVDAAKKKMRTKLKSCEEELAHARDEERAYHRSEDYQTYEYYRTDRDQERAVLNEAERSLQLRLNTSIQVWKRAMYEFHAVSDKKSGDTLSKLITYIEQNGIQSDSTWVTEELKIVISPLFHLISSDIISLKNAAERTYFSSAVDCITELQGAFDKYSQKREKYEEAESMLARQEAPEVLLHMQEKIQKLEEGVKDTETKISKMVRKEANEEEVEAVRSTLLEKMTACANYNAQIPIPVMIIDLTDDIS